MKRSSFRALAGLAALALVLAGCIIPPSMLERAVWGPPPETWQEQGRYRRDGDAPPTASNAPESLPAAAAPAPSGERPPGQPPPPWDAGVVDGAPEGRVVLQDGMRRGFEAPSGRTHIIELYQQVVDERDALAAKLARSEAGAEETRAALQAKSAEAEQLAAHVAALEAARTSLVEENRALAARLVQAQIRRLEAEKLLLETRIDGERARATAALHAADLAPRATRARPAGEGERP